MEIAIVDDLASERSAVRELIFDYFKKNNMTSELIPNITEFASGETFLHAYTPCNFDIILLDIYMDEINGLDVAKHLISQEKDYNIILFTSSEDHMLDGYDVRALGYILKPVNDHKAALYKALDRAMDRLQADTSSIKVSTHYGKQSVLCKNIVYLDISLRQLYIHFSTDDLPILGKYSDYKELLMKEPNFLECYRNIIVNMDYIDAPFEDDFLMKNGDKLPISRRKKADVMKKYMNYFINTR